MSFLLDESAALPQHGFESPSAKIINLTRPIRDVMASDLNNANDVLNRIEIRLGTLVRKKIENLLTTDHLEKEVSIIVANPQLSQNVVTALNLF